MLCDTSLLAAFNADRDHVLPEDVEAAVRELQWSEFSVRVDAARARAHLPDARPARAARGAGWTLVARLLLVTESNTLDERALRIGRLIIGRATDADLRVDSRAISRHHCQIITNERLCVLEDLNSTNGVFIKEKRVRRHNINDGDVVTLGNHQLM
jgi:hypothetical protein